MPPRSLSADWPSFISIADGANSAALSARTTRFHKSRCLAPVDARGSDLGSTGNLRPQPLFSSPNDIKKRSKMIGATIRPVQTKAQPIFGHTAMAINPRSGLLPRSRRLGRVAADGRSRGIPQPPSTPGNPFPAQSPLEARCWLRVPGLRGPRLQGSARGRIESGKNHSYSGPDL